MHAKHNLTCALYNLRGIKLPVPHLHSLQMDLRVSSRVEWLIADLSIPGHSHVFDRPVTKVKLLENNFANSKRGQSFKFNRFMAAVKFPLLIQQQLWR